MISLFLVSLLSVGTTLSGGFYSCPGDARCPQKVFSLVFKLCATDDYSDGKERTTCDWDKLPILWVYANKALCESEGNRELSVNYGDWRTLEHKRLRATELRCSPLEVLTRKDLLKR